MSAMGHEQTSRHDRVMSVIPLNADIHRRGLHVRLVPQADIADMSRLAVAISPASPISQGRGRSDRGLQGLGKNIPPATLAE
jgi:hypothetical protein